MVIEASGHKTVLVATSKEEALAKVAQIGEENIQVVTLDRSLTPHSTSDKDAQELLDKIRRIAPNVRVVGMGERSIPGVDIDVGKSDYLRLRKATNDL